MVQRKTPCIGVCSTGIGDSVCRGCKRFAHEIIRWNAYDEQERGVIWNRLEVLADQIIAGRIRVLDPEKLRMQARAHQLNLDLSGTDSWIVYECLRRLGKNLPGLCAIGCEAVSPWDRLSVDELRAEVETSFYQISCAHYERFFPGHL